MCIIYDVRKGVALFQQEKWANSHNDTQLLLNKSISFKADCVRSKHEKKNAGFSRKLPSANHMNLPR